MTTYLFNSNPIVVQAQGEQVQEEEKPDYQHIQLEAVIQEKRNEDDKNIDVSQRYEVQDVMDIWKKLIEKTSQNIIDEKEAGRLLYEISSEAYKRNIPEELMPYRFRSIINDGIGRLKELTFSEPQFIDDQIVYVNATEVYDRSSYEYRLKFIKENNQWCFAAQIE